MKIVYFYFYFIVNRELGIVLFYFLSEKIVVHEKDIWFFFAVPFFFWSLFFVVIGKSSWA